MATVMQQQPPQVGGGEAVDIPPEEEEGPDPMMLGETYIPGLEYIQDEFGKLSDEQLKEQNKIIDTIKKEYDRQREEQFNRSIIRHRTRYIHMHGALGGERSHEALIATKAGEMAQNGMTVCVLNINFLKRLATRALFFFIKDIVLKDKSEDILGRIKLKIQEEEADEEDREVLIDYFGDLSEDFPLFVITDETCQEPERLDPVIPDLACSEARFHFWSSSAYAHGKPEVARRYRMATTQDVPASIRLVMEMIDIDDDDVDITDPSAVPLCRILWTDQMRGPGSVRQYLQKLPVKMITHKNHKTRDVWECEPCGKLLAQYLEEELKLGKPDGLRPKDIFIVGSFRRFENMVSMSALQAELLDKFDDINFDVVFCRRTVKIQDVLKTTQGVIISDSVSVRGVDKAVVVVIPTPLDPQDANDPPQSRSSSPPPIDLRDPPRWYRRRRRPTPPVRHYPQSDFHKPKPNSEDLDDEVVLYTRKRRPGEHEDNEDYGAASKPGRGKGPSDLDSDDSDYCDFDAAAPPAPPGRPRQRPRMSMSTHHSLLRRCVNSLSRADKDMMLDLFTDAPSHAVLFHFAEDDYQEDPKSDSEEVKTKQNDPPPSRSSSPPPIDLRDPPRRNRQRRRPTPPVRHYPQSDFHKAKPNSEDSDDEVVLYTRKRRPGEHEDNEDCVCSLWI